MILSTILAISIGVQAKAMPTPKEIYNKVFPSVVSIRSVNWAETKESNMTGFIVAPHLIATCYHGMPDPGGRIFARFYNGVEVALERVATDEAGDLVLLSPNRKLSTPPIPEAFELTLLEYVFEDPNKVKGRRRDEMSIGDKIFVIGNPQGLTRSMTDGMISAFRESEGVRSIQFTAPVSKGSSGSPLLNDRGELIGIVTSSVTDAQALNFATALERLIALRKKAKPISRS